MRLHLILTVTFSLGWCVIGCGPKVRPAAGYPVARGDLYAEFRENVVFRGEPNLSGIPVILHRLNPHLPFIREDAGLNFEHIFCGHADQRNGFTPRSGLFRLTPLEAGDGVVLTREAADEPWNIGSTLRYRLVPPHYIDFEFKATINDASPFQSENYAAFFFASYMGFVADNEINFLGVPASGEQEQWVRSRSNGRDPGEHYIPLQSNGLVIDPNDPILALNAKHEAWPRITRPYYYGLAGGGMVYAVMFNKLCDSDEEMRFSVMRFRLAKRPSPAWDFGYVARNLVNGKKIGFRGRLIWKPFISAEDITRDYERWRSGPSH